MATATATRVTPAQIEKLAHAVIRIGLVVTIGWIGAMKYTAAEAAAIEPLVRNSPFMGWLLDIVDLRTLSSAIGTVEIVTALLIALGAVSAVAGIVGGALATGTFLVTLSFLVTSVSYEHTPPFFSPGGAFIIKDVVLLGGSLLVLAHSWAQRSARSV